MTGTRACPQCGDAIAGDSPEGLCPRCLLQSGFAEGAASTPPSGVTTPAPGTFVPPSPADLARHFPQLEILELLGQGGMGAVYKARQTKLDRTVAVKVLPPEWGKDPAFAERFAREAKALAKLTHPHIVAVHDFGESDGLFYLIMEYVDGANLRQILNEGRLHTSEALSIIPQVCEALHYAHEEGVVHRDIKPENILLDSKGRVKIADFGLAKLLNRPRAAFTLTGSQQVMGTLDYMAPEQRLRPQEVDHRADIYSLGVVFYEMLTGELPLGRFDPPSHKVKVDARLDEVVFRALEREPARRYQRASHVKSDLESIVGGQSPAVHTEASYSPVAAADVAAYDSFPIVAPAAGLMLAGVVGMLFWTIMGLSGLAIEHHRPGSALFLIMPALGIPAGIGLIFGAIRMMRHQSYGFALGSAIWAMVPWSPGWLIGLPCGILALVALRRPSVQAAFGVAGRERNPALAPAMGIFLTGIAAALFWTVMGIALFANEPAYYQNYWRRSSNEPPYIANTGRFLFLLMPLLAIPASAVLIIGARRMMQRRSYHLSVLAAMWATVPWSPFWIMGLPFGILALRALRRRDVQLAFGRPFQSSAGAFEGPFIPMAVAAPAPEPPRPTGPVRRGVRAFFGSMYSVMFHSRMETPTRTESAAALPSAIPVETPRRPAAAPSPVAMPAWQPRPKPKQSIWPWVAVIIGLFFLVMMMLAIGVAFYSEARSPATVATMKPTGQGLSILEDRYRDFRTKWGLQWFQTDAEDIFRRTVEEYLALEARFTKRERDGAGRLTITIKPFTTELQELDKRFQSNLQSVIERDMRQRGASAKGKGNDSPRFVDQSAFPFGKEEARIEIWRENNWYRGKVYRGTDTGKDKPVEEFSGPQLPKMYERFWTN
jgi:tRNA A-37 threonylcarbamoyl transferase component Bud32